MLEMSASCATLAPHYNAAMSLLRLPAINLAIGIPAAVLMLAGLARAQPAAARADRRRPRQTRRRRPLAVRLRRHLRRRGKELPMPGFSFERPIELQKLSADQRAAATVETVARKIARERVLR